MTNPGDMEASMANRDHAVSADGRERIREDVHAGGRFGKKVRSQAELRWRRLRSDERWERRVDYLMRFFSAPSGLLPRRSGMGG